MYTCAHAHICTYIQSLLCVFSWAYCIFWKSCVGETWVGVGGARNKIWGGGWYLGWDGNISCLFSSLLSILRVPLSPSTLCRLLKELQVALSRAPTQSCRDRSFMPWATSRSMGLFWQGPQRWMGIITVSLQRKLAGMKVVFNVQKSPCNYLKARGERKGDREWEIGWNESRWERRRTYFQVLHLERPAGERALSFPVVRESTGHKWVTTHPSRQWLTSGPLVTHISHLQCKITVRAQPEIGCWTTTEPNELHQVTTSNIKRGLSYFLSIRNTIHFWK